MILALTLAALTQDPAPPDVPVVIPELGGVEAPTQPTGRSTSTVTRGARRPVDPSQGATGAIRVRIRDLVRVRGQEENVVQGVGLVTGLNGTGDSAAGARQALLNLLLNQNIVLDPGSVSSKNVAVVWVQATLPPAVRPGSKIDVRVSSLYDAKSLVGGTLVHTELTETNGQVVFATAAGPISTGAFSAEGDAANATRNHPTVGTIPLGGKVEREVPVQLVSDHGWLYLDLRPTQGARSATPCASPTRSTSSTATPPSPRARRASRCSSPSDLPERAHVAYLESILEREIEPAELRARRHQRAHRRDRHGRGRAHHARRGHEGQPDRDDRRDRPRRASRGRFSSRSRRESSRARAC